MEKKYFNYYARTEGSHYKFKDIFVSQSNLCDKFQQLEYSRSNPLTIRLCLLQDAFRKLFDLRLDIRQRVSGQKYVYDPIKNVTISGTTSSMTVSDESIGEEFHLSLHDAYRHFYAFLSYFCSVLDRLAYEIHLIYDIGQEHEIDWRKFKGKNDNLGNCFADLKSKNQNLAKIIGSSDFSDILKFRDRLEHGKDDLDINGSSPLDNNFDFVIQNDENMCIVDFCQEKFIKLLQICEEIYKVILN